MSRNERREIVKRKRLCFNCLKENHFSSACPSTQTYLVCRQTHHSLLHDGLDKQPMNNRVTAEAPPRKQLRMTTIPSEVETNQSWLSVLPTALVTLGDEDRRRMTVRALLDPCSDANLIKERLHRKMGTSLEKNHIWISYTLESLEAKMEWKRTKTTLAQNQITWQFIPPSAPHFGGLWETGAKSMRAHLRRVFGSIKLTYEEFATLLVKIKMVLNSRPMIPLHRWSWRIDARPFSYWHIVHLNSLTIFSGRELRLPDTLEARAWYTRSVLASIVLGLSEYASAEGQMDQGSS